MKNRKIVLLAEDSPANLKKIVLVVDDSSANLQLCKGLLSREYDVRAAKSGKMALAAIAQVRPDVILLDIEMPDMTGFEVMEVINQNPHLKTIPVIFVTAHASEKLVRKALEQGAIAYLLKPFSPDILRAKLQSVLKVKS